MSIIDKGIDLIIKKVSGKETIRIEPKQLLQIVKDEFIFGADEETLKMLFKMAKGPFWGRKLLSKNERYCFMINGLQRNYAFGVGRTVWVEDLEKKCFYQISDRKWRKFKKLFASALNQERISRR